MNITSIKKQNKTLNHKATGLVTLKLGEKKNIHIVLLVNKQKKQKKNKDEKITADDGD